jgi:hypothetical protein
MASWWCSWAWEQLHTAVYTPPSVFSKDNQPSFNLHRKSIPGLAFS